MNVAISQTIASRNNSHNNMSTAVNTNSSGNRGVHHQSKTTVLSSQETCVQPFDGDVSRLDVLESQVQRLGVTLFDVNRKLDRLSHALLPRDTISEGGDSDENGVAPTPPTGPNFSLGHAFGSSNNGFRNSGQMNHPPSLATIMGNLGSGQKRTFANMKKKKKIVGFGTSAGKGIHSLDGPAGGDAIGRPDVGGSNGLDMASPEGSDLQPTGSQTFATRRMSQSAHLAHSDLDHGESANVKDVRASTDSLGAGGGFGSIVPVGSTPHKKGHDPKGRSANPPAFSLALGGTTNKDGSDTESTNGVWDFEPYHMSGNLNTVADSLFIFGATALSVLQIASLHPKADHYFVTRDLAPWWLVMVCTVLEALTGLWMVLKSITREGEHGWMSDTTKMTRSKYFRSFLAFDLLYTVPLELFLVSVPLACYWSMTRHWLRWVRIYTLRISDNPFALSRPTIGFIAFLGGIVMIHHIMASIAWWQFSDQAEGTPLDYLDALYWAVSTTTSTGYGDISPKEDTSRIVGMFSMISGGLIVAATTAFATSILTSRDALQEEHDKKKKMMQSMLEHYQIPWSLRQHVITLFPHVLQTHSESQFKGMMESLPPGLSQQLSQYVQAKMLVNVSVFKGLDNVTRLLPLVERLQQKFVNPQEFVVNQGEDSTEMYFLIFGTVQVIRTEGDEELILSTLFSGTVFGEMGVIRGTKRAASIQAVTACELMVLTKEDFDESIQEEGLEELISSNLENYTMPSQRPVAASSNNVSDSDHTPRGGHGMQLESVNLIPGTGLSPPEQMFQQQLQPLNKPPLVPRDSTDGSINSQHRNSITPLLGAKGARHEDDAKVMDYTSGSGGDLRQQRGRGGSSPSTDKSTSSEMNPLGAPAAADSPLDATLEGEHSFQRTPHRSSTAQPNGLQQPSEDAVNIDSE